MADDGISVVIPLYNKGPYIKRTIQSVLQQSFQNFEVIIVNDHSTDEGPACVREFSDPRIQLVEHEGSGVSSARNLGVTLARNNFIAFLDGDDEWDPRHLEILDTLRRRFPRAGLFVTAYRMVEAGNILRNPSYFEIPAAPWEGIIPNYIRSAAYGDFPLVTICVGIPKDIILEAGGFLPYVKWNEDLDCWFRVIMKHPVAFSWEGVAIWHRDAVNRVSNSLSYEDIRNSAHIVNRARDALKDRNTPEQYIPYLKAYIARFELARAVWIIKAGYPEEGRRILSEFETRKYFRKKIPPLLLSYIPAPIFRKLWKAYRSINAVLFHKKYTSGFSQESNLKGL